MTLTVTHAYVSSIVETTPSGGSPGLVGPTEWNANHSVSGNLPVTQLNSGSAANSGTFWRGDGVWAAPPARSFSDWAYASTNTTVADGAQVIADTNATAFTVTLPSSPAVGNFVQIVDATGTWATNNLTVSGNGANINSSATNLTVNVENQFLYMIYINSSIGWKVFAL